MSLHASDVILPWRISPGNWRNSGGSYDGPQSIDLYPFLAGAGYDEPFLQALPEGQATRLLGDQISFLRQIVRSRLLVFEGFLENHVEVAKVEAPHVLALAQVVGFGAPLPSVANLLEPFWLEGYKEPRNAFQAFGLQK